MPAQTSLTKKIVYSLGGLSMLGILAGVYVSPAMASSMTAIPPRLDITADPGDMVVEELKIRNDSDTTETYSVAVQDFIVSDSKGTPIPVDSTGGNKWSLKSWITSPTVIPVDANSSQVLKVSIKVPANALPGGHYAMITYQPMSTGDLKNTGASIAQRVGTLVYLVVSGDMKYGHDLKMFTTGQFYEMGPVMFNGRIENMSDAHIAPKGSISIYDPLNKKVAELAVGDENLGNIFPEVSRDFTSVWETKWGWGKYRADLNLTYGVAGMITASVMFWLFPIRLVIYSLLAIASVALIGILLGRKNRQHQADLESEVAELKHELEDAENSK